MDRSMFSSRTICPALSILLLAATAQGADTIDGQGVRNDGGSSSKSWVPYTSQGYVGINLGTSEYDTACYGPFSCENPDVAGKIYVGGQFNPFLGMEIGYVNGGKSYRNGGRLTAQGLNVSVVGNLPVSNRFDIFGKIGGTYGWTDTSASPLLLGYETGSRNGLGLSYGAGVAFDLDKRNQLLAEWDRQEFRFRPGTDSVNLYTVGWKYKY